MEKNQYVLKATNGSTHSVTVSPKVQALIADRLQQQTLKCSYIDHKSGLQLLAALLSTLDTKNPSEQIKKWLGMHSVEQLIPISEQLRHWELPLEQYCSNAQDADWLLAKLGQWSINGDKITDIAITEDSTRVLFSTKKGVCDSYSINGIFEQQIAARNPAVSCESIGITPDKQTIALSYADEMLVWRAPTNTTEKIPFGQDLNSAFCSIKTTPNGTLLLLRADFGISVYLVGQSSSKFLYNYLGIGWPVTFDPTGEFIYAAQVDNTMNLLLVNSKDGTTKAIGKGGNKSPLVGISTTHDGKYIITGGQQGDMAIYDFRGTLLATEPAAHTKELWAITTGYTEQYLIATGSFDGTIKLWTFNPAQKKISQLTTLRGSMNQICLLKFTHDDFWLFSWDTDSNNNGTTHIWDRAGNNLYTWNNTTDFCLSADNAHLALIKSPKGAVVYDMHMLKELTGLPTIVRAKLLDTVAQVKGEQNKPEIAQANSSLTALRKLVYSLQKNGYKVPALLRMVYGDN